ncbi:MAG: TolC family protein, partial [Planctomycetes bacterium]|nr:TolC family protein [Planctomycetota bacterium]
MQEASVRFTATQPLLKGALYPYNYSPIQVAENNRKLAMDSLETTISDLIFRIEAAYWQLVFSSRNYAANENSLKVATENVEKARKEEAAGTQPKIYVTTIEGQLARRKVEMNDALLQLENSRDNLLDLLQYKGESLRQLWEAGQKTGSFDGIRVIPLSEPTEQATLPERNPSLAAAFERRADYRQFAALLDNQKTLVDMRANERLPQLDLTGVWAQFGLADSFGDSFSSLGSGDFYGWTVGLQLAMPLSNRGLKSSYDRARDRYQQLKWQRLQTENRIIMEVDQSIRRLRSMARKLVYLDDLVRLKETELEAERRKLA